MRNILILFAHPAYQKSRINARILEGIDQIDGVTLHDLYQAYAEFDIDVKQEQELLETHDVIVFHHPFFWYSTPALLKEWQDLVLEHGWAYGSKGNALQGKLFFNVITTGGQAEAYRETGYNNFTLRQLIAPLEQTVNLCKMRFLPPFVIHGTHSIDPENVDRHREQYHKLLTLLRDEQLDWEQARKRDYMNDYFSQT